ncbi:hypothetical protein L3X38_028083 [Prunus dulcis]|uniref:Uncharacterized protein n=1 Tax=Prunus dulcis TaxID=3755 RepID=A0AAD4Z0W0_PRUDU|nr:hypothetical protein L3X38_028083 [Prunus dulcis]
MQAFNPNTNDHDYSVVVMVENRGFPYDQSLVKFPQVSIAWNVFKSYHVIQDDRLHWKPSRFVKDTDPLNSVDDMISNI